jgi:RimJ/RimL family protein N-acetyltransferase
VRIRPYAAGDSGPAYEAVRQSMTALSPWMPWCHPGYALDDSRAWIEAQIEAFAAGTAYEFAIVAADGRYLGGVGVNQIDALNRRANLGYWVRADATGRGVATAAARLARDWAFAHTDLARLELVIAAGNAASLRVAEKAGALREGLLRARLVLRGAPHDAWLFALLRGR